MWVSIWGLQLRWSNAGAPGKRMGLQARGPVGCCSRAGLSETHRQTGRNGAKISPSVNIVHNRSAIIYNQEIGRTLLTTLQVDCERLLINQQFFFVQLTSFRPGQASDNLCSHCLCSSPALVPLLQPATLPRVPFISQGFWRILAGYFVEYLWIRVFPNLAFVWCLTLLWSRAYCFTTK